MEDEQRYLGEVLTKALELIEEGVHGKFTDHRILITVMVRDGDITDTRLAVVANVPEPEDIARIVDILHEEYPNELRGSTGEAQDFLAKEARKKETSH